MGGVVSGIGDVIGGVGGVVSGVANQIPVIGPYVGPVVGGMTGGPLGFATSLAGNALQGNYGGGGGGGGSSTPLYAQPNYNYGNQTYQYRGTPLNTSKYFISGDRGVYNLLPALGQINAGIDSSRLRQTYNPNDPISNKNIVAANAYTPYEAYQDIQTQMANDPKALAAFNKAFKLEPISSLAPGRNNDPTSPMSKFLQNNPNPLGQYVNYGINDRIFDVDAKLGLTYDQIAKYAAQNKNPFFMPYETTQGATPLGFTPSANKLAAIDTSQYLKGYNTALTGQQQQAQQQQAQQQALNLAKNKIQAIANTPIKSTSPMSIVREGIAALRRK